MKISILVNELNIRGGTHKQVHRLAEYLISQGHDLKILTKIYDPNKCYPGIEKFTIVSFEKYFDENAQSNIFKKLINKTIGSIKISDYALSCSECINVHDNGFGLVNFITRFRNKRIPIIWQINDLPPVFMQGNSKLATSNWTYRLRTRFYKYVAKSITRITVNVGKNAQRVKEYLSRDADVIYCGVDLRSLSLIRRSYSKKKVRLVSTGVLLEYRNYETFLEVHYKLVKKGFNVESNIVGSKNLNQDYAYRIQQIIEDKNLHCRLTGDISEDELLEIYQNSDFFFFINIDQSWGLAVFEAMNLSLPVIVSESVGATELLHNNLNAIIVDPIDSDIMVSKVDYLLNNDSERNKLIEAGFNLTLNMTWGNMYCSKAEKIMLEELQKVNFN